MDQGLVLLCGSLGFGLGLEEGFRLMVSRRASDFSLVRRDRLKACRAEKFIGHMRHICRSVQKARV